MVLAFDDPRGQPHALLCQSMTEWLLNKKATHCIEAGLCLCEGIMINITGYVVSNHEATDSCEIKRHA